MCTSGGFHSQFNAGATSDNHVRSLRNYTQNIQSYQHDLNRLSKRNDCQSPKRDFFVEGQLSVRSPKIQKSINMFSQYQSEMTNRLASPRTARQTTSYMKKNQRIIATSQTEKRYGGHKRTVTTTDVTKLANKFE